jgi:hypothetical protein
MQNNRRLQLIQVSRNKQVAGWLVALGIFLMAARQEPSVFLNRVSFFNKVVAEFPKWRTTQSRGGEEKN